MKTPLRSFLSCYYCLKSVALSLIIVCVFNGILSAQTTISTLGSFTNDSTVSTVTFNFQNTNSYPIVITDIDGVLSSYGNVGVSVYYKNSAINGAVGQINTANGWTSASAANVWGIANTTNTASQSLLTAVNLTIPANATYGIAVSANYNGAGALRIGNGTASFTMSAAGCSVLSGTNIGYATVDIIPAEPNQSPRAWLGKIKFVSGASCTGTPNTATISGPTNICSGALFNLSANGYSSGGGVVYQWQKYNTTSLLWEDITGATSTLLTDNITVATQYRFKTTCVNTSTQTISTSFTVSIGAALPGGTYTINKGASSSATNFVSFRAAAAAMKCGITGTVNLNVVAQSGPYTENVVFTNVMGTGPAAQIRLNGNGNILQYANNSTSEDSLAVLKLKGTRYMTVDSLTVRTLSNTYGYGIAFSDTCALDSIKHCFVDIRSVTNTVGYYSIGVSLSGNIYNSTNYDANNSQIYIGYNHILGSNGASGMYAGIVSNWNYSSLNDNYVDTANVIDHNEVENFNVYGIQIGSGKGTKACYNNIHRTNKTTSTSFIGITCWMGQYYNSVNSGNSGDVKIIGNRIHNPTSATTSQSAPFTGIQVYNYYYNGLGDSTDC